MPSRSVRLLGWFPVTFETYLACIRFLPPVVALLGYTLLLLLCGFWIRSLFSCWSVVLSLCGGVAIAHLVLYKVLPKLLVWMRTRYFSPAVYMRSQGSWAVVTGASAGIGRAYVDELASQGMNIVLMSRSKDILNQIAEEVRQKHGVKTLVIPVDFCAGPEIYPALKDRLKGMDIGVLINNVGMSVKNMGYFHKAEQGGPVYWDIMRVNTVPVTFLTHLILPDMLKKRKGVIINVGSRFQRMAPFAAVYGATKSYVTALTKSLHWEYNGSGVVFQVVNPGLVATKMSRQRKSALVPEPAEIAKFSLQNIGIMLEVSGQQLNNIVHGYDENWAFKTVSFMGLKQTILAVIRRNLSNARRRAECQNGSAIIQSDSDKPERPDGSPKGTQGHTE